MARLGARLRSVLVAVLAVMLLAMPGLVGFTSNKASTGGAQTEPPEVAVLRKEAVTLPNGCKKEVFYADIYGQKGAKWKEVFYDRYGVWQKEVIYDSAGGQVIRLPEWTEEALRQKGLVKDLSLTEVRKQEEAIYRLDNSVPNPITSRMVTPQAIANPGGYYDVETNPIPYSGVWARHTLGGRYPDNYLLTYGDASYYYSPPASPNGPGCALPYRWEDVGYNTPVGIRDLQTDRRTTVYRTDFGPNQIPGTDLCYRIIDLGPDTFKLLNGSLSAGIFYGRTWLQVIQYNPA